MAKKKKPTGPTLKQVHRSGEVLIPGGMGGVVPFVQPKPEPPSVSHRETDEEILSRLDQPGIISDDDMILLEILQERHQEAKQELEKFANLLIHEMEKGTHVEEGLRKIRITGIYTHREEDAE